MEGPADDPCADGMAFSSESEVLGSGSGYVIRSVLNSGVCPNEMTRRRTYSYQERKYAQIHLHLLIALQAKRHVSHQKPWYEGTFRMGPILCLETRSIAELNIVCEQVHELEQAKPLT